MKLRTLSAAWLFLVGTLFSACGEDTVDPATLAGATPPEVTEAGPFDGDWILSRAQCNGKDAEIDGSAIRFRFEGASFQATVTDPTQCAVTLSSRATYRPQSSTNGVVEVVDQSVRCAPSSCSRTCNESVDSSPEQVTYTLEDQTLRFTSTSDGDGFCPAGQDQSLILTRRP